MTDVKLKIFEPPRLFEAFLRGRHLTEIPDIVARICGICPIAYQMSAVHAIERALGVTVDPAVRLLRRLFYCGEWIESHALHVFMLHAPDFLGYPDAIQMARDHRALVEQGLRLKKTGNRIVTLMGGREIHPVSVAVGGFYRVPTENQLAALGDDLKRALDESVAAVRLVAAFEFPDFEQDYEFVALSHPQEYPFNEGRLVSNKGLDIDVAEYENHFVEQHVEAFQCTAFPAAWKRLLSGGTAGAIQFEFFAAAGCGPAGSAGVWSGRALPESISHHRGAGH